MFKQQVLKKVVNAVLLFAFALSLINPSIFPASTVLAAPGDSAGAGGSNITVMNAVYSPIAPGSVNLLDPSRFTPKTGVNLKVSSEAPNHPGVDALRSGGSGYWCNSSSNVYMSNYSPSSLALTLDLGTPKTIDKLYLEIPNTIDNIQKNATRFEVYYSNDPNSWASAPSASDAAYNYDWKANGWKLAGGTETEGLWSYINYNGQERGYDTKTFLYPFTARYVMINTVLAKRANSTDLTMGISGLLIYGKDSVANTTALVPAKGTYSTWNQVLPVTTTISFASGQTLTGITEGGTTLQSGTDYSLSGSTVTFALPYLAKLPLGTSELTFHFNNGTSSIFALDVTARGYGENYKKIKMNAIGGISPYNILGGAMGTDEPVEGVTKRIREAYHAFYGNQPRATAADDHIKNVWNDILQKNVFSIFAYGRGRNNEFLDKTRDGEYGHKGVFDWNLGYIVDGAKTNDRQRIEIRPSEDSTGDFVAYEGDLVSYEWLWNIPDGDQWNQSNFRHLYQLKAVNAQAANTLPGGNTGGENGAYILAISISGTTNRDLVVNHNRYDGDKTLMRIPLKDIASHWIKVEINSLISDCGWLTVKITDTVTGKVYTFDSPDVYQVFPNQGAGDGIKDLWRRPERTVVIDSKNSISFETEYPATFDQYERPKWGIYRSSADKDNKPANSVYDAELQIADITLNKVASGISSVNLALNKKAYNVGPTEGANPIQMQSAAANEYGNANKLTSGVLQDPIKWDVTNVTSLNQIGNYSWLGTDGARKGSFVIDLGEAMDFSQIRLFAKSARLKGATVYVSDDFGNHTSAADFDVMSFTQVDKQTVQGYTYAAGNTNGGTDSEDRSYPIDLGKTYHSRYIKVTVENASGGNTGTDLTGAPRLTQVQVFNAPCPPQNLIVEANGPARTLKWDSNDVSEGYTVYYDTAVLADLPKGTASYTLPSDKTDLSKIAVRSKGTDPYSRKFMISAPAVPADKPVVGMPAANPPAGTYTSEQSVVLSAEGAKIYYTTDGSTPTTASTLYVNPIYVSRSMTIKAVAVVEGMTDSRVASFNYVIDFPSDESYTPIPPRETVQAGDAAVTSQLAGNGKEVVVDMTTEAVTLTGSTWKNLSESGKDLTVKVSGISFKLPADAIAALNAGGSDGVKVSLTPYTPQLSGAQSTANTNLLKLSRSITVTCNGKEVTKYASPVTLTFPADGLNLTAEQKNKLTGVLFSADGKSYKVLGGKFNAKGDFEVKAASISNCGILVAEDLTKINMTLNKNNCIVNDKHIDTDIAPMLVNDRTMIPVRFVAEAFGADVEWFEETQVVQITLDGKKISLTIGVKEENMEVAPFILKDRTMVPIRYISEGFGANVIYNADTESIDIYR